MANKREITATDPLMQGIFHEADSLGMQVNELAEKAGLNYHAVSLMRRGKNSKGARLDTARKLASAINREIVLK